MNKDSGKLHEVSNQLSALYKDEKKIDRIVGRVNLKPEETIEQRLERAKKKHEELNDNEPAPGVPVPINFIGLKVNDELRLVKGIVFKIVGVDVEANTITVRSEKRV